MRSNNLLTLMDQFFDDTFRPVATSFTRTLGTAPALNVKEFKDRYEISLTIPGIDPKEVKVELNDKILNISYEHKESQEEEGDEGELLRQEYSHYSFSRSVALPKNVDDSTIGAKTNKGVLTVSVKKSPEIQPKKVDIKIEE